MKMTEKSPEIVLRGVSTGTFGTLEDAGKQYLNKYYPKWLNESEPGFVPPVPWKAYNRALGPNLVSTKADSKRRGDDAEIRVYKALANYSAKKSEPMFSVAGFSFDKEDRKRSTVEVLWNFLGQNAAKGLEIIRDKFEIDMMIFHRQIGVVLVEVKATTMPENDYSTAAKTLKLGATFLNILLINVEKSVPIHRIIIFPNAVEESLPSPEKHPDDKILCFSGAVLEDTFEMDFMFSQLKVESRPAIKSFNFPRQLDSTLSIVVALKCQVSATVKNAIVTKILLSDEKVSLVKQAKETDKKLVRHDVFSKADIRQGLVRKVGKASEVLFLNPEQLTIWEGPKWQSVSGIAGTGKTVLIQHMALNLAQQDEGKLPGKIFVLATDAIAEKYQEFFDNNKIPKTKIQVLNFSSFRAATADRDATDAAQKFKDAHLFIDEMQNIPNFLEIIATVSAEKNPETYFWVALDPVQALEKVDFNVADELASKYFLPCLKPLYYVMRCTPEITNYWSTLLPESRLPVSYGQGNRLFVHDVPIIRVGTTDDAAKYIWEKVSEITGEGIISARECAVLIHNVQYMVPLRKALVNMMGITEEKYMLAMAFGKSDQIMEVREVPSDIWSLEWIYVFLVANHSYVFPTTLQKSALLTKEGFYNTGVYLAASRCNIKLFLVVVSEEKPLDVTMPVLHASVDSVSFSFDGKML